MKSFKHDLPTKFANEVYHKACHYHRTRCTCICKDLVKRKRVYLLITWLFFITMMQHSGLLNLSYPYIWWGYRHCDNSHQKCTYVTLKVISIKIENSPASLAILLSSTLPPQSRTRLLSLATIPGLSGPEAVTTSCWTAVTTPTRPKQ